MKGHNKVVEQLLPLADPSHLETAMLEAARKGHENIVARLFALSPSLDVHTHEKLASRDSSAPRCQTAMRRSLHSCLLSVLSHAMREPKSVKQPSPQLKVDMTRLYEDNETAIFRATRKDHETTVLRLLTHNPDSIDMKSGSCNLLHAQPYEVTPSLLLNQFQFVEIFSPCDMYFWCH